MLDPGTSVLTPTASPKLRVRVPLLVTPLLLLAIGYPVSIALGVTAVLDPPWLFTSLNLAFLTVIPVAGAALAALSYRRSGVGAVLAIGAGLLVIGVGCGLVAAVLLFWVDVNASVSVQNVAVLVAGACQLGAAVAAVAGVALGGNRRRHLAAANGGVLLALAAWVALVLLADRAPDFLTAGASTPLRVAVLGSAAALFLASALLWWQTAVRDPSIRFLRWYVPGLAVYGFGVVVALTVTQPGTIGSWVVRVSQYLGVIYMFAAVAREAGWRSKEPGRLGMALLQASLPLRALVESTSDGIVALGPAGRVTYWNAAATRMFGHDPDEAFDRDPLDLLAAGAEPEARTQLEALLSGCAATGRQELLLRDRRGRPVPVDVTVLGDPQGRLRVCVVTDVGERMRAREQLEDRVRQRTAELERANRAKDEFLGLVSHELKTPVTSIVASSALLERRLDGSDPDGIATVLVGESARLARIIDNLLILARLDAQTTPEREPVALDRLVSAVVAEVGHEFRGHEIRVRCEGGVIVEANPDQLAMVVRNYVVNALKYSRPDAAVEVLLCVEDGWARVDVVDEGVGLDEADRAKVFDAFFRSSRTSATPGIGIGLTVCRRIVESHGGRVSASARSDGPGSVFTFELPPAAADEDDVPEAARHEAVVA